MNATADTPAWAQRVRLPSYEQLRYTQTLMLTIAAGMLAVYVLARGVERPGRLVDAARRQTGI